MRETTVVENVLLTPAGKIIKSGTDFCVRRTERGKLEAVFENQPGEARTVKFTLTGMNPYVVFDVLQSCGEREQSEIRRANRAGILEIQTDMPENSRLWIQEREDMR